MMMVATRVFFDDGRMSWTVEYETPDRQELFGRGPLNEERARDRAAAMGLPRDLQVTIPLPTDLTGRAFDDRDWE